MKRFLTMLLALCLLGGAGALADITADGGSQATTVTYTITENKNFTVTIPATLSIDSETNEGSMELKIDAAGFNAPDYVIAVCLTGSAGYVDSEKAFYLTNGTNTIPYELQRSDLPLRMNEPILTWTSGSEQSYMASVAVKAIAAPGANLPAGTYTDTLTFTSMLIDMSEPNP